MGARQVDAEMAAERGDSVGVVAIGISIFRTDDDGREIRCRFSTGREHGRGKARPIVGAQREEGRDGASDVAFQSDIAFETGTGHIGSARALLGGLVVLLDGVTHQAGFRCRFCFRFNAEPGAPFRCIANKLHVCGLPVAKDKRGL